MSAKAFVKSWIGPILVVLIIAGTFYGINWTFGLRWEVVVSPSMTPTLIVGDIVVSRAVDPLVIEVGDIIVFKDPRGGPIPIVHRVIAKYDGENVRFITKGDYNPAPDPWIVYGNMVLGRYIFKIPQLGKVKAVLDVEVLGIPIGILITVLLLIMIISYDYVSWRRGQRASAYPRQAFITSLSNDEFW